MIELFEKYRKKADGKIPRTAKTNKGKPITSSKCGVCDTKKFCFIKEQEVSGLLRSLGIRKSLNKIPLLGLLLF